MGNCPGADGFPGPAPPVPPCCPGLPAAIARDTQTITPQRNGRQGGNPGFLKRLRLFSHEKYIFVGLFIFLLGQNLALAFILGSRRKNELQHNFLPRQSQNSVFQLISAHGRGAAAPGGLHPAEGLLRDSRCPPGPAGAGYPRSGVSTFPLGQARRRL